MDSGHKNVVIIAHGSFRCKNTAPYVCLSQWLAYSYDVITFDFRGHGESGGGFDFSDAPVHDLKAVIEFARGQGYERVGVFGRSLGAWIALLEAARYKNIDSLVAAASPLGQVTALKPLPLLRRVIAVPLVGTLVGILTSWVISIVRGTHMVGIRDAAVCPIEAVPHIFPTPILFIYQEFDWVIKTDVADAVAMYDAAQGKRDLLILAGPGHIFEIHQFHRVCEVIESWFRETLDAERPIQTGDLPPL
jgi:pimeloyl-ACP methyl ester carboxylesterase